MQMIKELKYAPREIFDQILEYAVIPTIDLIIWFEALGCIMVNRKIPPYKKTWALPGLRVMKPDGIDETIKRIAKNEIGIKIDPEDKKFIGQFMGRFRVENNRQDLSTCYAVSFVSSAFQVNTSHFSGYRFIKKKEDIPARTGGMYRYYLDTFFSQDKFDFNENKEK
jgi:8-oxo-dGTP pyrophosphatase MutT (NUDIX family)